MWFLYQMAPQSITYNIYTTVRIGSELDLGAWQRAWQHIVERHQALRTTYTERDGQPVQVVRSSNQFVDIKVTDATSWSDDYLKKQILAEADRPYNLETGPVLRVHLFTRSAIEHIQLLAMHHIAGDMWSFDILLDELRVLYAAEVKTLPPASIQVVENSDISNSQRDNILPLPTLSYTDYVRWQTEMLASSKGEQLSAYWLKQLAGELPLLDLPMDKPRPREQTYCGATHIIELDEELPRKLRQLSESEGTSLYSILLAAFFVLLYRLSGQEDIRLGTPMAGRSGQEEFKEIVGNFTSPVVCRANLGGNPTFKEFLAQVSRTVSEAREYQDYPFPLLVKKLSPDRDTSRHPLFQVSLTSQKHRWFSKAQKSPLEQEKTLLVMSPYLIEGHQRGTAFDVDLAIIEAGSSFQLCWQYNTDLFDDSTIARQVEHFQTLLEGIVTNPQQRVSELPLLTERERSQLLVEWNNTTKEYPSNKCIHQLFEEQVERSPDAIAVVFEGEQLTYRDLNQRTNRIAHHLKTLGVGPEVLVGICVERSLEMVVGLLGILKAGGTYVPLDPAYPQERLAYILNDSQVSVLLTQEKFFALLGQIDVPMLSLDTDWGTISQESEENPVSDVKPENLAYVIYTSGSTGNPKGVLINHHNVARLFAATRSWFNFSERDIWTLFHSYAFDFSVWEIVGALIYGGKLVVVPYWVSREPEAFYDLLCQEKVTVLNQTPSAFRQLINAEQSKETAPNLKLRLVIFGGEALELQSLLPWFERHGDQLPQLVNMYGITETTVHVTYRPLTRADLNIGGSMIGSPIPDLQVYILDQNLQPVPIGVKGEIHVGGAGLARGYLNRPDLTADKFIPNPFSHKQSERLYKTGDLARYLSDGNIEYLGRIDHQVKIRGFRIEPGEIESVLSQYPAVQETVAIVREDNPGDKRLVAYIVPDFERAFTVRQLLNLEKDGKLNNHLRYELPNGMVIVHLNQSETNFVYQEIFEEKTYLKNGITLKAGDCIFDVGANIGMFSLFMAQTCKDAVIYAFEPIPPVFEVLALNASLYGLNIKLFDCGLSSEEMDDEFTYYPYVSVISGRFANATDEQEVVKSFLLNQQSIGNDQTALSSAEIDELLAERLTSQRFNCHLKTISGVIRENGVAQIDLLKIDAEKSEMFVLAGIEEEDWSKIRQMIVEVHDIDGRLEQITILLKKHGYELTIEQDALLKDTGLYNIYAVRHSLKVLEVPEQTSSISTSDDSLIWTSPKHLISNVRNYLTQQLPAYMVPGAFVLLPTLPLTANGKVDRHALPVPDSARPDLEENYIAPSTPVEKVLAQIWSDVLDVERVGVHDKFLELGGHSLLATQIVSRLRDTLKVELPISSLLSSPTIAELALRINEADVGEKPKNLASPIQRVSRNQNLPLSWGQEQLWFFAQLEPNAPVYNEPCTIRFPGAININALEKALNEIIKRHESLRTRFLMVDGEPVQVIAPPDTFNLVVVDLRQLPQEEREAEALRLATIDAKQLFDLTTGPLWRATLMQLADVDYRLFLTFYHIIMDAVSIYSTFLPELAALYKAFSTDKPSSLVDLPVQYADFAVWQRQWLTQETLARQLNYWKQQLADLPVLQMPYDRLRPAIPTFRGARQCLALSKDLTSALKALSQQEGVTLYMTLLAAFKTLLYRYTGSEDIVVGTFSAGRNRSEIEGTIGYFLKTLVVRTDLSLNPSFLKLLSRVRKVTLEAYAHEELPFQELVKTLKPERNLSQNPLFQVSFVLEPPMPSLNSGWTLSQLDIQTDTVKSELGIELDERPEGIIGRFEYNTDLFDDSTISRMIGHFQTLLEGIVANPLQPITELPLLTSAESHQLLVEWNNTQIEYPIDKCIHQLFEEQVERSPDAIAVVFEDKQLTYRELNQRANCLAHHLKTLGVGPEVLVGICVERSLEMVVGLLGILKAGGAYVPLDPAYPTERLAYMLSDSQVKVLLTQEKLASSLPVSAARVIYLDSDWQNISDHCEENPLTEVKASNLAYVIYTSGSTGKPKGVLIEHQAIASHCQNIIAHYQLTPGDRILQFASMGFDVSLEQILPTLIVGATLILSETKSLTGSEFHQKLLQLGLTVVNLPPVYWTQWLQFLEENFSATSLKDLRLVICGGEAMPPESLKLWQKSPLRTVRLLNAYGPTETTITTMTFEVPQRISLSKIPIGRPLKNRKVYILSSQRQLVPIGVPGELYIGGAGVARGYLNRSELTAERFIPNPFSNETDARLYKTGDIARYLTDGNIEFLGRLDNQVKIRGFRIELGEIEAVLTQHPEVNQAVVVVHENQPGNQSLVAYIVPTEKLNSIEDLTHKIKTDLRQQLPEYMVPATLMILSTLPLTPNGKVDRRALPPPEPVMRSQSVRGAQSLALEMPQTKVEKLIAEVWQKILLLEEVGLDDNFFDLGGTSLRLVQVREKLQIIFTKKLSMVEMFQHPTVRALSQLLSEQEFQTPDALKSDAERAELRSTQVSLNQQRHIRQQYRSQKKQ